MKRRKKEDELYLVIGGSSCRKNHQGYTNFKQSYLQRKQTESLKNALILELTHVKK